VKNTTFVVFDAETTGLDPLKDHIIELAAVRIQGGQIQESQSWLINPGIPIPPSTQRIHGISTAMVSNAPAFPYSYSQFITFVSDGILLSHNARFDRRFLMAEISRHNLSAPDNTLHDTLRLFKRCFPKRRSYSLENLTRDLCPLMIPSAGTNCLTAALPRHQQFHSASWDAECTAALFLKAVGNLPDPTPLTEFARYCGAPLSLKVEPASKDQ